ncbi:hypothetical protein WR25_05891 [Diploscapter pachys]|uniref:Transcription initiation factor TFIID subunit 2 n=1 Tax=Diploscapter pachys TaxID=2018661 RepID=A0A2A2KF27_9BILA|nr:hypothetical protein WR25_05891 [Diploscapter pachys]
MVNGAVNGHVPDQGGGQQQQRQAAIQEEPTTAPHIECADEIRVLTQVVIIDQIDFAAESFRVHTDLIIAPIVPNLTADTVSELKNPAIGEFSSKVYETYTEKDYQLLIMVPDSLREFVGEQQSIKVSIDVMVVKPKHSIQFSHATGMDGITEKGAHLFTYRSSYMSGTREWLPCRDSPDQLSLWRLKITCDVSHTAVASAELDVELSQELDVKVYHFQQSIPTAACSIGFAVGQFVPIAHPEVSEVTSFALPGLVSLVKHTTFPVGKIMEYFEELLSCRFPYPSYKLAFVDKSPDEVTVYAGLTLFSVNVLYHKKIIDAVQESRQLLAFGVAQQFFGSFITPSHWVDWWLVKSLARLITSFYIEKVFGTSEFLYQLKRTLQSVCDYEYQWGKASFCLYVVLRPRLTHSPRINLHFDPRNERTCSPLYADALAKKGHLVLRMLYKRLGHELFFQVLQKILTVAQQMSGRRDKPVCWTHLVISTESFFRTLMTVSGQEMRTFQDYWIYEGGHVVIEVSFQFNRKRNIIELEAKQDIEQGNGRMRYLGPLTVVVQELDGSFSHTVQIDSDISRSELQCHSKGRRQKKAGLDLF